MGYIVQHRAVRPANVKPFIAAFLRYLHINGLRYRLEMTARSGTYSGVVKFAQVVGVFPGPRFDDAEGVDQSEADVELLGWDSR